MTINIYFYWSAYFHPPIITMSLSTLFSKLLHPNSKSTTPTVKKQSSLPNIDSASQQSISIPIPMERETHQPITSPTTINTPVLKKQPESLPKGGTVVQIQEKRKSAYTTVNQVRETMDEENKRKIRANYSPSIIVRELPKEEKSDVDDLADLLGGGGDPK